MAAPESHKCPFLSLPCLAFPWGSGKRRSWGVGLLFESQFYHSPWLCVSDSNFLSLCFSTCRDNNIYLPRLLNVIWDNWCKIPSTAPGPFQTITVYQSLPPSLLHLSPRLGGSHIAVPVRYGWIKPELFYNEKMESRKGRKAEKFESRDIKRRELAEGKRKYRRRKKKSSQRPSDQNYRWGRITKSRFMASERTHLAKSQGEARQFNKFFLVAC